jgi:protein-disulfide isomerase
VRRSLIVFSALALAGVVISHQLVELHAAVKYAGASDTGICATAGFSCTEAASSRWSTIGTLPIAALGEAFYATFLLLALLAGLRRKPLRGLDGVFLGGSLLAVGYSVFLLVTSLQGGYVCPKCVGLYIVNAGMLVTALVGHAERIGAAFKRLPAALGTPAFFAALAVMVVATIAAQGVYAHQAQAVRDAQRVEQALNPPAPLVDVDPGDSPAKGPADAPVVVVEFSDFECPFCKRLTDNLREASKLYPQVRIHFRHFPMDQACNPAITQPFHQHACLAAYAAECAERNGRFWEMHDRLFAHNGDLSRPKLLEHARAVGLDVESFDKCLDDPAIQAAVRRDAEAGIALQVQGTPTFFVNGRRSMGAKLTPEQMAALFRELAREKEKPQP